MTGHALMGSIRTEIFTLYGIRMAMTGSDPMILKMSTATEFGQGDNNAKIPTERGGVETK